MAVDSVYIVAGTSLATIIATGLFNVWSKRIDAKQKLNEHKLTVRSAFVNIKIEAGIQFTSEITARINRHFLVSVFYKYLYERKAFNKKYYDFIEVSIEKQREVNLNNNNSHHLFFDVVHLHAEANEVINEINSIQAVLEEYLKSGGANQYTDDVEVAAKKTYELNEKVIRIYQKMNVYVRTEVGKYDIV